jgi:small-conductance mechanosensitive channel
MWEEIERIWQYQVLVIDGQAVTVGKIAVSVAIFLVGILIAGVVVRLVTRRLAAWAHLKEGTAAVTEKALRYTLYVLVALFALRIVNIPLGAFAFLGGALAIGVGFGAQNIINNFISGFILMTERPIGIGDLVEVDGVLGRVEAIGGRSTRVRTGENIHILVPNSSFLEKNIINWTLSDARIRSKVPVGVVYGSPVREVERLLLRAARENPRVLPDREPFVLFQEFGDNALIFEVYFWIQVRAVIERRRIESDLRFRIDELFREAGIVIAFPQRDVHLDAAGPIPVRIEG